MRSNLSLKFTLYTVHQFQKNILKDKELSNELKNKNISRYITVDVINRKGLPDLDDVIRLIKLGNDDCDDNKAYEILNRWLEDDTNKERGLLGAFSDLCNDYALDVPVDSLFKEHCKKIEEIGVAKINMQDRLNNLFTSIGDLVDKLDEKTESIGNDQMKEYITVADDEQLEKEMKLGNE